ncbi:hypothetical protein [Modestobacter roseus]|uniref:Uncharacterized protein n=1 Tax=Modestobacter roseus TaxID=1181884 RepID=A0A562IY31_9ACTN|nr:hypothetical protein [Modestobacter roseus]MQA32748.1 hypothetical protein [Modestobacter roseus]TWH75740.1 hypothetical protein JD78_04305 [Modestobacter roseus]
MTAGDARPRADRTPTPLTDDARRLLDALLAHDFLGVAELRAQVVRASSTPGCRCGCGTLDLHVPDDVPTVPAGGPAPVEGTVVDADGTPVGGVLLFVEDGRLSRLDITSHGDPLPLPSPDRVTWGPTRWAGADTVRRPARFRRGSTQ